MSTGRRTNHAAAACAKGRCRAATFGMAFLSFSRPYYCEAFSPMFCRVGLARRTCQMEGRLYGTNPVFGDDAPSSSRTGTTTRKKHVQPSATRRRRLKNKKKPSDKRDTKPPLPPNPRQAATRSTARAAAATPVGGGVRRRPTRQHNGGGGVWHQRLEMLDHDILTRERELELGSKVVAANELRSSMAILIEDRRAALEEQLSAGERSSEEEDRRRQPQPVCFEIDGRSVADGCDAPPLEMDGLDLLSVYGYGGVDASEDGEAEERSPAAGLAGDEWHRTEHRRQFRPSSSNVDIDRDDRILTDDDIKLGLGVEGGRTELRRILLDGLLARDELMRSNVRLVVSIAKRWMKRSARFSDDILVNLYAGGWDKPSLDEVVQEGVVGLSRAVDKYEPKRGLRFGTYATHWITSYVRQCFRTSATGCLRVPTQLHEIKGHYLSILKEYSETKDVQPSMATVAAQMGVSEKRLKTAIRVTRSLRSIDAPVFSGSGAFKGSGAGGDIAGENGLLVSDTLQSTDAKPEDLVELSLLRQCLENAMATELSPHERDVLRLRLGLDDGRTRTVKEVVEVCGGGVSVADVRRAEKRAFRKLRSPNAVHAHNLLAYLDFADLDYDVVVAARR